MGITRLIIDACFQALDHGDARACERASERSVPGAGLLRNNNHDRRGTDVPLFRRAKLFTFDLVSRDSYTRVTSDFYRDKKFYFSDDSRSNYGHRESSCKVEFFLPERKLSHRSDIRL